MKPDLKAEHEWLSQFVGEWVGEGECPAGPDSPTTKFSVRESGRMIGDAWLALEATGQMPDGGASRTIMTLGYDPAKGKFVGTFIGSMMTHLWVYSGSLDAQRRVLTLEAEGPDFANPGRTLLYQDIVTKVADDHRKLESRSRGEDGTWGPIFMTAHYRRR